MNPYYGYQLPQKKPENQNMKYIFAFVAVVLIILIVGSIAIIAMFKAPASGTRTSLAELNKKDEEEEEEEEPSCKNLKRSDIVFVGCNHAYKDYNTYKTECNIGYKNGQWIPDNFPGGSCSLKRGDPVYGCESGSNYYVYGSANTRGGQCGSGAHADLRWVE